jgi:hypothetical protein
MLLDRHLLRPRPATFAWLIGLGCYAVGVGCQMLGELGFLSALVYRLWYLSGAFFAAAYLGMGSLYLTPYGRLSTWSTRALAWASVLVTPVVLTSPIDLGLVDAHQMTGAGFPEYVRLLTPAFNVFGTLALIGVALRTRRPAPLLIAAGALVTASGATLLRFGVPGGFYGSQLVGIVLMWLGFATPTRRTVDG